PLELVGPALDRRDALVELLQAANALLQVVQTVPRSRHRGEHAVPARRIADPLDRLLAEVGEPIHDVLSGSSHRRMVTGVLRPRRGYAFVLVALLAATAVSAGHARRAPVTLRVMTRNLYLGANLDPIVKAKSAPEAFAAVAAGWAQVQANDFPVRARARARELAAVEPLFGGFQAVTLYRAETRAVLTVARARGVALACARDLSGRPAARPLPCR